MSWRIEIARDAKKELARLPAQTQARIALYFADAKARQISIGVIGHRREVYRD